jgi:hypothetical protein
MVRLLVDNEADVASMSLLREGLRIDRQDFSEAMFAWKALLYYKWRLVELTPTLRQTAADVGAIMIDKRAPHSIQSSCDRFRANIKSTISAAWREANLVASEYDRVYRAVTEEGRPGLFRQFLYTASSQFIALGDRIGRLEHACGFWSARFPNGSKRMEAEELCAFLLEFDRSLATELTLPALAPLADRMGFARLISDRPEPVSRAAVA